MKPTSPIQQAIPSWEAALGKDVMDRTKNLANEMNDFRKLANLPVVNEETQERFTRFIHGLGADMLKTKLSDEKERQLAQEAVEKKKRKVASILRKKVKVTDFEDGGLSIAIDQEWDTSTWSDDLIAVGCEALILIFHDDSNGDLNPKNVARKERAVYMLLKLLSRHTAAEVYIRRNIERLISKSVSKVIRSGRSCALLDLLNIVNCCKDQFPIEMSQYNFNGRAIEMMIQEARLAAILIQHMYRARRSRIVNAFIPKQRGFGSEYEVRITRIALINARSSELRENWHILHGSVRPSLRKRREAAKQADDARPPVLSQSIGGLRGPVHMGLYYSEILLEIVNHLCSDAAGKFAHGNREDVVRSHGCILLSSYLASPVGRLCPFSACILAKVTKVPDSFNHILKTGCISSAVRVFKYMRLVGATTTNFKPKKKEKVQVIDVYLSTLSILSNSGAHASGLYRAAHGYGFLKISRDPAIEDFNYLNVLKGYFEANRNCSAAELEREVELSLGHPDLLKEIAIAILTATVDEVLNRALYCLLTLLSSYSHGRAVAEMIALAGSLMVRLVQLLHTYHNNDTSNLALCILVQACTLAKSRDLLFARNISQYLNEMNRGILDRSHHFDSIHYQRSVLVSVCMCRQGDWRLYDPQILPNYMMDRSSRRDGTTNPNPNLSGSASPNQKSPDKVSALTNAVKKAIYLDVLRTMKCPAADQPNLTVADLVVMPTHPETPQRMSETAAAFEPKTLVSFFCHPEDPDYYESLSLDECAATCTIFEGFSAHKITAEKIYDPGLVRLMGKYLFLCKYLFLGKPMSDGQVRVLMSGVSSCGVALAHLARTCTPDLSELRKDEENAAAKVVPKATNHLPMSRQSNRAKLSLGESSSRDFVLARAEAYLKVSRQTELTSSVLFFVNTLSVNHPKLQEGTRRLQELVGVNCLQFLISYATMLLILGDNGNSRAKEAIEQDLYNAGTACIQLLLQLKAVHGRSTSYVLLLDHMCTVLCKVTTSQEASFLAVNEWSIFKAMHIYMPSPLSGMLQEEEERVEVLVRRDGKGGQKRSFSAEVTEESLGRMQEDIKVYKVGLHNLPASYFELLASLCKVDQARSTCLTDGYLRRSLEKFAILFSILAAVDFKPARVENPDKVLSETVACLKVLSACANHTSVQKGSANDIILSRFFHVEEMCQGIILARNEIPRSGEAVHYCYDLLAALTRDTHRVLAIIEEYDLFSMVRDEVNLFLDIPLRTAECLVAILKNATQGITSNYLHRMIPLLREPLAKIARIYPSLAFKVDEANWNMTKSLMMFRKAVDDDPQNSDFEKFRAEEFIRTGKVIVNTMADSGEKNESLSRESPAKTAAVSSDGMDPTSLGTYIHCGVSSCGSLRHMDSPTGHGNLTLSNVRLPSPSSGMSPSVLEISKLSARQSSLQSLVQDRKAVLGFIDPNLITRPDSQTISFSPQRKILTPPHNNNNNNNRNSSSKKQGRKDIRSPVNLTPLPNIRSISLSELPELILTRPPTFH